MNEPKVVTLNLRSKIKSKTLAIKKYNTCNILYIYNNLT